MRDIRVTLQPDGAAAVEGFSGYAGEHNATRLLIELNEELSDAGICFHTLCFDLYGLGRKAVSGNIYAGEGGSAYRQGLTLVFELPEALTSGGELLCQVEGHRTQNGRTLSVVKSAVFTLPFEPSLTGDGTDFDDGCDWLARLFAALDALRNETAGLVICSPREYAALPVKDARVFYPDFGREPRPSTA